LKDEKNESWWNFKKHTNFINYKNGPNLKNKKLKVILEILRVWSENLDKKRNKVFLAIQ